MIVFEFKLRGKQSQYQAIDEMIRTSQFIRNSCLKYWIENSCKEAPVKKQDLNKYTKVLADAFRFAKRLNAMSRQAAAERAWFAISRFYDNCKKKVPGKKDYPRFKKNSRSFEYKTQCWKLLSPKRIRFNELGEFRLLGKYDLAFFNVKSIKRIRIVRRADGYYAQFCIDIDVKKQLQPTGNSMGLDIGLEYFYTDSEGNHEQNPRFFRKNEKKRVKLNRRLSRTKKGSKNRTKARNRLARLDLKTSRQRIEHAKRLARCVVQSNDLIVLEDLKVSNLVKNRKLAKSISDAGWYQFRTGLEYFATKFGKKVVAVAPHYTSQNCSQCGKPVKKSLSTRTHTCTCGCQLQRDHNAAINILNKGIGTVGHTETSVRLRSPSAVEVNASGEKITLIVDKNQLLKIDS